jgi:hypothetical protein
MPARYPADAKVYRYTVKWVVELLDAPPGAPAGEGGEEGADEASEDGQEAALGRREEVQS